MNWVDLVVLALLLLAARRGFQAGALTQVAMLIGLGLGLVVGVILAPPLSGLFRGTARALVALLVTVSCTAAVGLAGEQVGRRARRTLRAGVVARADALAGAAVGTAATLLVVWVFGTVLSNSRYPTLNRALQESRVLRGVDGVLPPLPGLLARVESFLSERGYPVVFVNLPPGTVTPAVLPDEASIQPAFLAARDSTVKVVGTACDLVESGSGFVAAPGLVVTNAHVVAGEAHTRVVDASGAHQAEVVLFDPGLDVAALRVPGLADPVLPVVDRSVARGTTGAIMGYPEGGPLQAEPAAVTARLQATGLDIYGTAVTNRSVYELHGEVRPGNSGGPLVASGEPTGTAGLAPGTVIGLIFASSSSTPGVGYALTMDAVSADISRAGQSLGAVSTGACLP